jgi:PleD family two-component response regulator
LSYVLFADDDERMRLMVRDMLVAIGHEVELAHDGNAALESVRRREPDILLLDVELPGPGPSGLDVCRALKQSPFTAQIPVLMVTGRDATDQKLQGFEAGADDYLAKPFDARELRARVGALLRLVRRVSDLNPTSGLPGARAIEDRVQAWVDEGRAFVVCYADIDNFKAFADNFGFAAANDVIRGTAAAIRRAVENFGASEDFAGHIGGDDFVVLTDESRAVTIARHSAEQFNEVMRGVVGPQAVDTGRFLGRDREGAMRWLPMSRLSIAILTVSPDSWVSAAHLGARVAESKRKAKLRGPGTILLDVG